MGLPPELDDYFGGAACALCEDVIFDGKTPFYVEAWVFSVDLCPGVPGDDPNGIYLLSQVTPCAWELFSPSWRYRWALSPGVSVFTIQAGPGIVFTDQPAFNCIDTFQNTNLFCAPPVKIGINGWATIFWGPGIGPV